MRISVECLSKRFHADVLTLDDADRILSFCRTNPEFYRLCHMECSPEQIRRDLAVTPPGKPIEDKYFFGFYDDGALIALMDLILGYPSAETAFIGLFMVHGPERNRGIGSGLITEVCDALRELGFSSVRLGIHRNNTPAKHFWAKNNFLVLREVAWDEAPILLAERRL